MRATLLASAVVLAMGCGSSFKSESDGTDDTAEDTAADTGLDAPGDTGGDTATDTAVDTAVDTVTDTATDTSVDVVPDGDGCIGDDDCMPGANCCSGRCVNLMYDPDHCSACGTACPNDRPFCDRGTCTHPPCDPTTVCTGITYCCGVHCCAMDQICCIVEGPGPMRGPECYDGFCPGGCPDCD